MQISFTTNSQTSFLLHREFLPHFPTLIFCKNSIPSFHSYIIFTFQVQFTSFIIYNELYSHFGDFFLFSQRNSIVLPSSSLYPTSQPNNQPFPWRCKTIKWTNWNCMRWRMREKRKTSSLAYEINSTGIFAFRNEKQSTRKLFSMVGRWKGKSFKEYNRRFSCAIVRVLM